MLNNKNTGARWDQPPAPRPILDRGISKAVKFVYLGVQRRLGLLRGLGPLANPLISGHN